MVCPRCGRQFDIRNGRCPYCGTVVSSQQNYQSYNRGYQNYSQQNYGYNPYGFLQKYDIFSFLGLCFAAAYLLLWMIAAIAIWHSDTKTGFVLWFVLPTIILCIPAVVFSILGMFRVRKNGKRGKDFALVGLVASCASFLPFFLMFITWVSKM